MSGLNRSDLQTLRAQTIYKNGQQKIKGQDHTNFLIDLIDSCANLITDKEKLNIYEYNNSLAYSSGVGVLYSGGLYQANKDTGLGAFNVADWDLISSGGGSSTFKGEWITLTTYAIGDFVVEAGDMYVCTTGNTDASFTPSNWLKVIEGNITQVTSTLSFDDGSTNTDWDGDVFPSFQGPVNNQLASRVKTIEGSISTNPSDDIAYISNNGSDTIGEYEIGNPLKPFLTFGVAINAIPVGGTVKTLGGTYDASIESLGYILVDKNGVTLDISGSIINGRIFFKGVDITLIATASIITDTGVGVLMGINSGFVSSNLKIIGGDFVAPNGGVFTFSTNLTSVIIRDATFLGSSNSAIGTFNQDATVINCKFTNQLKNGIDCISGKQTFSNCSFFSQNEFSLQLLSPSGVEVIVRQCELRGRVGIGGTNSIGFIFNAIVEDSYIQGSNYGAFIGQISDNVRFTNCVINGDIDCVRFSSTERTTANNNNIFERCSLYAGSGNIFAGTFAVGDLGNAYATNCIYNKAFVSIPEVVENGTTTIVGIQNVEF